MPDPRIESVARSICQSKGLDFVRFCGEGNFKETFEARTSSGDQFALKVFKSGSTLNARTQLEIDAMQRCSHSNIARVFSVDRADVAGTNYLFILEEYLNGGTLTQQINSTGRLTPHAARTLGLTLSYALAHLIERELVHRDIKPDNIMFRTPGDSPVLVDFSLVRDLSTSGLTESWWDRGPGTPYYSAPEQLNNDKSLIDWRTDQFALGVTLALCTFGCHPYAATGDDKIQTVEKVANRRGPDHGFASVAVAANMDYLSRMVAPWPIRRYRTVDELTQVLA